MRRSGYAGTLPQWKHVGFTYTRLGSYQKVLVVAPHSLFSAHATPVAALVSDEAEGKSILVVSGKYSTGV